MKELVRSILICPAVNRLLVRPLRPFALLSRTLRRLPVSGKVLFRGPDNKRMVMLTEGLDPIASRLFWSGMKGYEPHITRILARLCRGTQTVFDVGANTGFLSLFMATMLKDSGRVFSFEPVPRIHAALKANIEANALENCTARKCAVTDTEGPVTFYIPRVRPLPQSASLRSDFRPDCEEVKVDGITLDSFAASKKIARVGLVKIDVEASAAKTLLGMRGIMEKDRPEIVCEILPQAELDKISALLKDTGYALFFINADGSLEAVPELTAWRFRGDNNFLLSMRAIEDIRAALAN